MDPIPNDLDAQVVRHVPEQEVHSPLSGTRMWSHPICRQRSGFQYDLSAPLIRLQSLDHQSPFRDGGLVLVARLGTCPVPRDPLPRCASIRRWICSSSGDNPEADLTVAGLRCRKAALLLQCFLPAGQPRGPARVAGSSAGVGRRRVVRRQHRPPRDQQGGLLCRPALRPRRSGLARHRRVRRGDNRAFEEHRGRESR